MNNSTITSLADGKKYKVKLIQPKERYGRENALIHDDKYGWGPLIEFYFAAENEDTEDRFVSRYYFNTLQGHSEETGLVLDGGIDPKPIIDRDTLTTILWWVYCISGEGKIEVFIGTKLSPYIARAQKINAGHGDADPTFEDAIADAAFEIVRLFEMCGMVQDGKILQPDKASSFIINVLELYAKIKEDYGKQDFSCGRFGWGIIELLTKS